MIRKPSGAAVPSACSLHGPLTHGTGIILLPADPLYDIALVPIGTGLALIIEATEGQIMCRTEPQLL